MNRRSFLSTSGSIAGAAALGLGMPGKMRGQSSGTGTAGPIYANVNAAHALAAGQGVYNPTNGSVWYNIGNPLQAAYNDWIASGYDVAIMSAAANFDPTLVKSESLDQASILAAIQATTPEFTASNLQAALSYIDVQEPAYVEGVLLALKAYGMSHYFQGTINESYNLATHLGYVAPAASPNFTLPPENPPPTSGGGPPPSGGGVPGGGGGGGGSAGAPIKGGLWTCSADGAFILATGVAFATITVMTLGTAPVLVGAAWAGIGLWGGLGSVAWGVGHTVSGCPL